VGKPTDAAARSTRPSRDQCYAGAGTPAHRPWRRSRQHPARRGPPQPL